jgi:hypothetical protein
MGMLRRALAGKLPAWPTNAATVSGRKAWLGGETWRLRFWAALVPVHFRHGLAFSDLRARDSESAHWRGLPVDSGRPYLVSYLKHERHRHVGKLDMRCRNQAGCGTVVT